MATAKGSYGQLTRRPRHGPQGRAAPNAENLEKYHPTIWDVLLPESIDQQSMLGSYDVDMMSYAKLEGVELPPIEQQVYGLDAIGISGSSALLSWSTAKSGDMRVVVTGESGTVIDEAWASATSDNLRVIGGLTAGSSYTATVMAEGASESVEFVTGADHDQSAPEMLGETYEEDSGNYRLSFYTTEPLIHRHRSVHQHLLHEHLTCRVPHRSSSRLRAPGPHRQPLNHRDFHRPIWKPGKGDDPAVWESGVQRLWRKPRR